uniref:HNH endonuclease signature motif containing protein n=1 Tax=Actinomyces israelii TaxID=1659 RepID=UPI00226D00CB
MRALLPRADAVLLDATLDAVTASARATGDNRTPAQLRADTLTAMTLHALRTTHHTTTTTTTTAAAAAGAAGAAGAAADGKNTGSTGNAGDTGPGTTDTTEVADPAGTAEVAEVADAAEVVEVAGPADPERPEGLTAPADPEGPEGLTGLAGPVGAVGFTGLEGPAPDPAGGADPAYIDEMGLTPDGVPLEGLLTALSGLVCHTSPWWTPSGTDPIPLPPGLTVSIDVTVPLNHLTDLLPDDTTPEDDPPTTTPTTGPGTSAPGPGTSAPGTGVPAAGPGASVPGVPVGASLGGRGRSVPVPAAVARALAAGGTWRRLVTDPLSGAVTDVGRTRYRPPAALADLVRARDTTCTHPGCERPARGCEIDHVRPWAEGGTTSLENLTCLCRAHHRLKHTPGWALTRTPHGTLVWRTPTGARYQRDTDGTITLLPRRTGPGQETRPATRLPHTLASAITPQTLNRLHKGLTTPTPTSPTGLSPHDLGLGHHAGPLLTTHGPHPNQNPGDYETTPYHP